MRATPVRLVSLLIAGCTAGCLWGCASTTEGSLTTPDAPAAAGADAPVGTHADAPMGNPADAPIVMPLDAGAGLIFDPCAADPRTGYDPQGAGLAACCVGIGPAHCVPSSQITPSLVAYLSPCPGGDSVCMPDPIIRGGGQYRPPSCTSSVSQSAGACLSSCLPIVSGNPLAAVLRQDSCGAGELCIPCQNPLDGSATGACSLVETLCPATAPDAGTGSDAGVACPYTGPPIIDPGTLAACSPTCAGSHCVPASLVPAGQQPLLAACAPTGGGAGLCAPDELITTGGNFIPKSCTSVAGAEGRCLSTCLPDIAEKAALLPTDVCAANERCAPCFDPTSSLPTAPTGACTIACDKAAQPPVVLTCPWSGPPVIDASRLPACSPTCGGSHCVPAALVPAALQPLLAACTGGFCAPDPLIESAGNFLPKSCRSIAGVEGRCLSTCLPSIGEKAALLPEDADVCAAGEVCAPCFDPTSSTPTAPTGACTIGCDHPAESPVELGCNWTGPDVVDPTSFPACTMPCGAGHCVPGELVPTSLQSLLATCATGFCAPDPFIKTAGHFLPKTCASIAGVEGRCLSTCLPEVAGKEELLPGKGCATDERCVPCFDPTASDFSAPTGACTIGCDKPASGPVELTCPWTGPPVVDPTIFDPCSTCAGMHCVPADMIPANQQGLLAACPGGFCAPDPVIASDDHWVPQSCISIAGAEGRCLPACLPSVADKAGLLPDLGCPAGNKCVPCFDPTSSDPSAPTDACSIACDAPKKPPVLLTCPWSGPAVIDPTKLKECDTPCPGLHCLPAQFVPADKRDLLAPCDGGSGFCTPDPIIQSDDNWVPDGCVSLAGVAGRCLSACLPPVAAQPLLPQGTCGPADRCVPCFDPTAADWQKSTGACSLGPPGCDNPGSPTQLTCPWLGPDVIDPKLLPECDTPCGGSHCLPAQYVPAEARALLASCQNGTGFCTPDPVIETDDNWVPTTCASVAGVEGRCLSTCLPPVADKAEILPDVGCPTGTKCVPCYDPTSADWQSPTQACSIASCDMPHQDPIQITCPWTGLVVISPLQLPDCAPACAGAHCLPDEFVPPDERGLLTACPGGSCTPDTFIATGGEGVPTTCTAFNGIGAAEGRCLSTCIPLVSGQANLEQSSCPGGTKCVPCTYPIVPNEGQSTSACDVACDEPTKPPFVFPSCCPYNGGFQARCIPRSQIPGGTDTSNLQQLSCDSASLCIPKENIPMNPPIPPYGVGNPQSCSGYCVFGVCLYSGHCFNKCLDLGTFGFLLDDDGCPGNYTCAPE